MNFFANFIRRLAEIARVAGIGLFFKAPPAMGKAILSRESKLNQYGSFRFHSLFHLGKPTKPAESRVSI
jgi:hypothetical protein